MAPGKKVFIAVSGGVDSSTAAALLLKDGFDCSGVFMITSNEYSAAQKDAEKTSEKLGIKLFILDLRQEFEKILQYFCSEYSRGRTPNPCVVCNKTIKFGKLLEFAKENGAELFATGHYARVIERPDGVGLFSALNAEKDQSYALSMVHRDIFKNIILPLGNFSKEETKQMAAEFGLEPQNRIDSQEICFIPDNDYVRVLEDRCPNLKRAGKIVDTNGLVLGEHSGIHRFTRGQRRGLNVAMGKPYYVIDLNAETNTVILGPKDNVMGQRLLAKSVHWLIDKPQEPFEAKVKIRYNSKPADAIVTAQNEDALVEFTQPVGAITPGQLAAFYVPDEAGLRVAGAGWIEKAG